MWKIKKKVLVQSSSASKAEGFLVSVVDRNSLILHMLLQQYNSLFWSVVRQDKTIDFIKPEAQQKGSNHSTDHKSIASYFFSKKIILTCF